MTKRALGRFPLLQLILMIVTVVAETYREYFAVADPPMFVSRR